MPGNSALQRNRTIMNYTAPLNVEGVARATAAQWFAARQQAHDPDVEQQFARWLAEDPQRSDEYAIYQVARELSDAAAIRLPSDPPWRPWYRRPSTYVVTATLIAIALVVYSKLRP